MIAIIKKASLVEETVMSTSSRKQATLTLTSSRIVVIDFSDGSKEDCNRIDDLGVEAEKTLHRWRARPSNN